MTAGPCVSLPRNGSRREPCTSAVRGGASLGCRSRNSWGWAGFKIIGQNALFPQRVLTEVPSFGQPGGRGRRFGHAAAGPQCDRNRQDVGAATETRPTPVARRPTVLYDRPASCSKSESVVPTHPSGGTGGGHEAAAGQSVRRGLSARQSAMSAASLAASAE